MTINDAVKDMAIKLIELIREFMALSPTSFIESMALVLAEQALDMAEHVSTSDEATDAADKLKEALEAFERAIDPEPYELRINTKLRGKLNRIRHYDRDIYESKVSLNVVINSYNKKVFSPLHKLTVKIFHFKMRSIYFLEEKAS